jgi:hypothetical protein
MEKKIILKEITLTNWRSINQKVVFDDVTTLSGANGVGKSSVMKAFYWLLTSSPHPNEMANFNLFDCRVPLTPETPKACVKAKIEIDGIEYTIERCAIAKFVRKRSTNEWEKAPSDSYELFIDEIETTATNFKAWVEANLCPSDMLKYCLDGGFFVNLAEDDMRKGRKVLEMVIGEIKEEDMKGDYSILAEDFKKFTVEQIEERSRNEMRPLRARMLEIPAIIESKEATYAEYKRVDYDAIMREIEAKKAEIEDIDNRILGNGKAIEPILGRRDEILEIINFKTLSLNDSKVAYLAKESAEINALKAKIDEIKRMNAMVDTTNLSFERKKAELTARIARYEAEIVRLEARRESLIKDRDAVKARVFVDETCAYCGQELPFDMQEKAKAKFNESRARELEDIVTRGKNNNLEIERGKTAIEEAKVDLAAIPMPSVKVDTAELEAELARLQSSFVPFENTDEYARLVKEIEDLKATMPEIPTNDNEALTSAKRVLMNGLDELNRRYGLKYKADEIWEEIESLKQELRSVGASIAMLEGKIDKCKEYMQEKADIISYRVNGKLEECKIDMWSEQKDGSLVADLVIRGKNGVKFGSLNFAHQIRAKIELCRLFASYFGLSLPIWVDEARVFDSNTTPKHDNQMVFLYANDNPYLTVEHGK